MFEGSITFEMYVPLATIPLLATIATFASALAAPKQPKPPAFFLAGDSTTAVQSANGGGTVLVSLYTTSG